MWEVSGGLRERILSAQNGNFLQLYRPKSWHFFRLLLTFYLKT
ncbi:hypothetical protein [Okeania sp. SIO3I5]|nr:hypothetical protein [Okeania sp. SIO3I5]